MSASFKKFFKATLKTNTFMCYLSPCKCYLERKNAGLLLKDFGVCVCVCVCVCVHACVCACVCASVRASVRMGNVLCSVLTTRRVYSKRDLFKVMMTGQALLMSPKG